MNKSMNPHDKLFKEVLSRRENIIDFLNNYLPKDVLNLMDLNTIEIEKDSFIEKDLEEYFSDILYKVMLSDNEGYIYMLFEHKSYPHRLIVFQLLRYMLKIWELHRKQAPLEPLPVIIPMVLYHGMQKWNIKTNLADIISGPKDVLNEYIPDFKYILYDLSKYTDEEIKGIVTLKIALLLFKHIFDPDFPQQLKGILSLLRKVINTQTGVETLETVMRYIFSAANNITVDELKQIVEENISRDKGEDVMTLADRLREEGMQQGVQQTLLSTIKLSLNTRFGKNRLNTYKKIKNIEDVDMLQAISEAIIMGKDIKDIEEMITG